MDAEIVVGRVKVDNYIMGVCHNAKANCTLYDSTFVTKSIHYDAQTHVNRVKSHSDEDNIWNNIVMDKKKLIWGSLCYGNPYMIMKWNNRYLFHRRTGPCEPVPLFAFLSNRAINNTILMMIVDYGFLDLWRNAYNAGKLSQYKNLVVFCLDEQSYNVMSCLYRHS